MANNDDVPVTIDQVDAADAQAAGQRPELIEQAQQLRLALAGYTARTVPKLGIDDYATKIHHANNAALP